MSSERARTRYGYVPPPPTPEQERARAASALALQRFKIFADEQIAKAKAQRLANVEAFQKMMSQRKLD